MKHNFANIQIAFNFFSNNCSKGSLKKVGSLGVGGRGLAEKQTKTNRGKGDNTHTIVRFKRNKSQKKSFTMKSLIAFRRKVVS